LLYPGFCVEKLISEVGLEARLWSDFSFFNMYLNDYQDIFFTEKKKKSKAQSVS